MEGDSAVERERAFEILEKALIPAADRDLCLSVFDGEQCEAAQVLETIHTVPFLGDRRLVYVRRFDRMKAEDQELIAEACKQGFAGAVLVLAAEELDRRKTATKVLLASAVHVEVSLPRGEGLLDWVMAEAERLGIALAREGAALLAERWGNQPDGIVSELEKVAAYVGQGHLATAEDVLTVVAAAGPSAADNEIFRFCDATADGRVPAALACLDRLLGTGAHPSYVLTMLARHFRHLLAVRQFGGRDAERVRRELGLKMPTFGVERLMRQASRYGEEQLMEALSLLLTADLNLKRGAEARAALEWVTVALATLPATNSGRSARSRA